MNPHALRHTPLKRTCLPFHHPSDGEARIEDGKWKMAARKSDLVLLLVLVVESPLLEEKDLDHADASGLGLTPNLRGVLAGL